MKMGGLWQQWAGSWAREGVGGQRPARLTQPLPTGAQHPAPGQPPLCEDILQQVVQAGLLGRAGRQQAGNEVAALGDRWVGSG